MPDVAGGLENVEPSAVQVWLRKDGAEMDEALCPRAKDENGAAIPVRKVTFDPANARRYTALEIDLELSPELPVEGPLVGGTRWKRKAPRQGLVLSATST